LTYDRVIELAVGVVAALATGWAAWSAWQATVQARGAVDETRKATRAQLMASLLDSYDAPEMFEAMLLLREAWDAADGYIEEFRLRYPSTDEVLGGAKPTEIDHARRRVAAHFLKVHRLWKSGLLTDDDVKAVLSRDQVTFYFEVIEPLQRELNPFHDLASFRDLGGLVGIKKWKGISDQPE
jgi:hypothetical protein